MLNQANTIDFVTLRDTLDHLARMTKRKFPTINHGGCAVYAHLVGRQLGKLGIPYCGIVGDWCQHDLDNARNNIRNPRHKYEWNSAGVDFGHVGIEFFYNEKPYWYESDYGVKTPDQGFCGLDVANGRLMPMELRGIALEAKGWNWSFDRRQIPRVRSLIRKHFQKLAPRVELQAA